MPEITPTTGNYEFLTGLSFGLLIFLVFAAGYRLGLRKSSKDSAQTKASVEGMLEDVVGWTSGISEELARYRSQVDSLGAKYSADSTATNSGQDLGSEVVSEIMHANEKLQNELDRAENKLKDQATQLTEYLSEARTDPLTQLPNRRAFDEVLGRRMAEWGRYGVEFSVIILDVDRFKRFNDKHGHAAGDVVLKSVGKTLQETLRESDIVARYGGEEFAIILPNTPCPEGCDATERIRTAVEATICEHEGQRLQVTISCGMAQALAGEPSAELIKRADEALYASKNAGRNASFLHDGNGCVAISPEARSASNRFLGANEELGQICQDLRQRLAEVTE